MAAQKDMQDLLRLLTTGRNKIPMLAAMGRVKALQGANLRSITDIAASDVSSLSTTLSCDEKTAKALLAACKAFLKSGATQGTTAGKRSSSDALAPSTNKRARSAYELAQEPLTPAELEASLALPQPSVDEEAISKTTIVTNRAPLVLAFAVQLLKYTMPEQPLSGRLSLAQAVCSANSRSKAVSLGIEKRGVEEERESWGRGQPKVRVMGREVSVLKRGGYEWREEEIMDEKEEIKREVGEQSTAGCERTIKEESDSAAEPIIPDILATPATSSTSTGWTVSSPITVKESTFIARSHTLTSTSSASSLIDQLLSQNPSLKTASHNISAYRILSPSSPSQIIESSTDDGESGGGNHVLSLLRADNLTNVIVVVSRWYGGVMLGTDRWRIMSMVCRDALAQRLRIAGTVGGDALWGLDLEGMRKSTAGSVTGGEGAMPICRPEGARAYILKAFSSPESAGTCTAVEGGGEAKKKKTKSGAELDREREENLGLLLGALDLLFKSWEGHVSKEELDRRAWGWYVNVRPDVAGGVAGWGGKGEVKLSRILGLRRKE
ncbi:related to impact protein [Rhynchosporium graminicola]|uniref:Related to impact protein n=1 Tax=Rhynchosporium graminicola TaxID=2792576 RepID=A0A1E1JZT9_9HELO|nr:related to impact protein [Rhynchosporium commune]